MQLNQSRLVDSPDKSPTFPTGGTWEETYTIMASLPDISRLLRQRRIATVDEYFPIRPTDKNYPMSYRAYTDERIGIPNGLGPENWIRPDGAAEDPIAEAARFEAELQNERFVITNLGIGPDPKLADGRVIPVDWNDKVIGKAILGGKVIEGSSHIGFVPKGISPDSGAILVYMDEGTIFANKKYAPDPDNMPGAAITQAHGDFRRADLRVVAATGTFKQRNVEKILFEVPTPDNPASMVNLGETVVLLDANAAERTMKRLGLTS
ncbi:MAG: glucosamine-6-phosphate isomerase, glucosamine-6-phosphate deaminase [Candidatus Gottesmanbacteria bacterium GW2011_GWA2_43_14]|uniref:Glucosamine-6-phosphate isomerase, glucosamine-6-phosphate deaminase n=1 Tax=Candidatus Gottesmanbacteria bacterium GW2011_GWA2_43_14 TaxID=1618443 RepID=A0A0G1DK67_9BACT|nr:MAG: glucosamine-6-phosphate isomerase, glucosamine-6-phosphate deaminase [Candidatus Gottesmanbacteria bacterium GW2011_GWA2_43_14]